VSLHLGAAFAGKDSRRGWASIRKRSNKKMSILKKFLHDETGLELSEYVIASFLITLAVVAAFSEIGTVVRDKIVTLTNYLNSN
jgi:Flp pilus assembly pilin Flp